MKYKAKNIPKFRVYTCISHIFHLHNDDVRRKEIYKYFLQLVYIINIKEVLSHNEHHYLVYLKA